MKYNPFRLNSIIILASLLTMTVLSSCSWELGMITFGDDGAPSDSIPQNNAGKDSTHNSEPWAVRIGLAANIDSYHVREVAVAFKSKDGIALRIESDGFASVSGDDNTYRLSNYDDLTLSEDTLNASWISLHGKPACLMPGYFDTIEISYSIISYDYVDFQRLTWTWKAPYIYRFLQQYPKDYMLFHIVTDGDVDFKDGVFTVPSGLHGITFDTTVDSYNYYQLTETL